MKNKNEVIEYELRKEASELIMSPEELRKLKSLFRNSEELRTNHADKKKNNIYDFKSHLTRCGFFIVGGIIWNKNLRLN